MRDYIQSSQSVVAQGQGVSIWYSAKDEFHDVHDPRFKIAHHKQVRIDRRTEWRDHMMTRTSNEHQSEHLYWH